MQNVQKLLGSDMAEHSRSASKQKKNIQNNPFYPPILFSFVTPTDYSFS